VRGPLAPYAEGFRVELERLGYTPLTAATHVRLLAHLSRWLAREGVDGSGLTPAVVDAYFAERRAAGYVGHVTGRALQPLLGYLQRLGVVSVPAPEVPASPEGRLLASYRDYLITERGLAAATVELNVRMVRPFLLDRLGVRNGRLDLEQLTAGEVTAFVVAQSRQRPKSVQRMLTGLRSLLGFLHVVGIIDGSLASAVPAVAGWTQSGLPKALDGQQVAALLACCDERTPTGRRDLAILTLLVRLGLRAGEVAALMLDDIDWRRGEITVRGKGNRHDRLPLPADVGERIVAYLRDGRPRGCAGPGGVRPRAGPLPGVDLQRRDHGGGLRGQTGRVGHDRRASAASLRGHRHAAFRRVVDRDRSNTATRPPAHHRALREGRPRRFARAGPPLAG